jgi:acetylxylan esterase
MMSNVMAATYPDLIQAVSLYSGVAAGCFVSSSNQVAAWNNTCSAGQSITTSAQWTSVAKAMYPGYSSTRPRMQIWHGSVDTTLYPQNYQEEIKQWTGVFGVSQTATLVRANYPQSSYTTSDYGPNVEGIYATGVGHSVPSHLDISEAWFGLASNPAPDTTTTTSTVATVTTSHVVTSTTSTPIPGTVAQYGQCGGLGWSGGTICASPYVCKFSNAYYSQCL